ncbi:MAG: LacI family transcriptional regulator [Gaiellaceae bacterium]|nr:LacI family transcriptional regulator [Gaiellaceae bacterium]
MHHARVRSDYRYSAADVYEMLERQTAAREEPLPADGRRTGVCVAVVVTDPSLDEAHPFFGPLVRSIRMRAARLGQGVFFAAPRESANMWLEEGHVEACLEHGAEGVIVLGGSDGNPDVLSERFPELPVVFVEYDTVGGRSAHVGMDNERAFAEIVTHLATAGGGHQRIATITGGLDAREGADRLLAYRSILQRLGYEVRKEYIEIGDFEHESGYVGMKRLLALDEPPDAVAAASDVQAVAAIRAIEEAGLRCPQDIAVTGFDDADWAATLRPALTTVRQPAAEMGIASLDAVLAMIDDPQLKPPTVLLPGTVVVRESCGA